MRDSVFFWDEDDEDDMEDNDTKDEMVSCPECGSYSVTPTTRPAQGQCEYRCDDCGHYFVDKATALHE